ncbi:unnamed protein product [Prunus armeniaca]|uniref:APS kinase domain-containing protein n=1 Tax=Prunus armeniaca TaxID=36596 RepID=A0A6J5V513_PRUAR|nr:unnamed protein product [Prunus armeniaca]
MSAVVKGPRPLICGPPRGDESGPLAVQSLSAAKLGFLRVKGSNAIGSTFLRPIKAMEDSSVSLRNDCAAISGRNLRQMSTMENPTNIVWHKSPVEKRDRQHLLQQKGCAIWITGLSGSGKSTVACALSQGLHIRGKLTYILDGDNVRHGLNRDLSFKAEDRAENIRRIGGKDRDVCRALFPEGDFIEVFMDVPLHVCENRDPKGLYKLARAGKIKGFTGVDDPYEPPLNCEIVLQQKGSDCVPPGEMAETVISYLEEKGYLQA